VRVRTAQKHQVQQARLAEIVHVLTVATEQRFVLNPFERRAKQGVRHCHLHAAIIGGARREAFGWERL
jgi:hypothetical protein